MNSKIIINNEVAPEQCTPQLNSQEADVNSAPTINDNCTTDNCNNQVTNDKNSKKPTIPDFYNYKNSTFMHTAFAKYANIIRVNGTNHIYRGSTAGIYVYDDDLIKCTIQKLVPKFNFSSINEEFQQLRITTKLSEVTESPCKYVAFNNGVYDLESSKFKPFAECNATDYILVNKFGIDYAIADVVNSSADVELIEQCFDEITGGNAELKEFILQVIADCCIRGNLMPLAFILSGSKANDGRQVMVDMLNGILGNCVAHENLQDLASGKSSLELYTKTCNISNEQEPPKVNNMNTLRGLISGKTVTDKKSGLEFKPYATMIFNVTDILNFDNSLSGLEGYFKVIPFENELTLDRSQLDILLNEVNLQYITLKALQTYCKVSNSVDREFTIPAVVERATKQYLLYSNSAKEFIETNPIFEVVEKRPYYDKFVAWCEDNNRPCISDSQFGKEVLNGKKYIEDRISDGVGGRPCYYTVKNFSANKLRKKYLDYMLRKTNYTEVNGDRYADKKFVKAFADYFIDHTIDEEDSDFKSPIEELKDGSVSFEDVIGTLDNVELENKQPQ